MSQPPSMQAPSIPNLLSLRGFRGGLRGRGRGRGGHPQSGPTSQAQHDATIQGTDTDAAVSRLSAVDIGYLEDPYAQCFVQQPNRRLPIINRGTYTRTTALDRLIESFLDPGPDAPEQPQARQIISLGAGTDTRCFRLFAPQAPPRRGLVYHEIDFPASSSRKRMMVQSTPALRSILPDPVPTEDGRIGSASWRSNPEGEGNQYWCHGLDLRHLAKDQWQSEASSSRLGGLRTDVPTLLVSECCLCYLETSEAKDVVKYFVDRIPDLGLVLYEPVKPDDAFGRQMVSNLAARKITMPTLDTYRSPESQEDRLRQAGFKEVRQRTVDDLWAHWVPEGEKERLDSLEGLDEVEEWQLLAGHYVVAWGWRGQRFGGWSGL